MESWTEKLNRGMVMGSSTQEFYRDGKPEGEQKSWHENGTLGMRVFYQNGTAKEMMRWFDNGNLEGSLIWQSETSQYKFWDIDGNLWKHDIYRNGLCETKEWYHNGQLRIHGFSRSGIWDGTLETWHDNGYPKTWEFFRGEECREGECKCWLLTGSCLGSFYRNGVIIDTNFTIRKKATLLSVKRKLSPLKYIHVLLTTFILGDLTNLI
jgi:antitoxin component YwqK of YwqJK toxin-antitoxin module